MPFLLSLTGSLRLERQECSKTLCNPVFGEAYEVSHFIIHTETRYWEEE